MPIREDQLVADVMLRNPKTLPGDATVEDVQAVFTEHPSVQLVLLADGQAFRGAIASLPDDAPPLAPALGFADPHPESISATETAAAAFERSARHPHRRLVVLDDDNTLVGLVCLDKTRTRFCGTSR
jgi:CBS domain-containing protein